MRLSVRYQLSLLLVLSSTLGLATLSIATWFSNRDFVLKVAREGLEAAASLKAVDLAVSLDLMYVSCLYLTANGALQAGLLRYDNGSEPGTVNWDAAAADLSASLSSIGSLRNAPGLQGRLYARNTATGGAPGTNSVLNVTGPGNHIKLPWSEADGRPAYIGQGEFGYPPSLYPNLTISRAQNRADKANYVATYDGETLGLESNLVLGPLTINDSFSLMSMTLPVIENNSETNVLGWLTVVQSARLIEEVINDHKGLGKTGLPLLVGPVDRTNHFPSIYTASESVAENEKVRFLFPPAGTATSRHANDADHSPFPASYYPAVESAISDGFNGRREIGSILSSHNENGVDVAVAYATPPTKIVDWIVLVERTTGDVWQPVSHLRVIILACLFSTLGFFFLISLPVAHWAVRPITRLRAATETTMEPLYDPSNSSFRSGDLAVDGLEPVVSNADALKPGFVGSLSWWRSKMRKSSARRNHRSNEKRFRIPAKVDTSRHWVKDDISDLMETFNDMSDELMMQYAKLEARVQRRTAELEVSKRAAEAANESKTLFVANVSHELKTPLNGILGLSATSIEESDVDQMRTSLSIIYKSGDMLLRTLNDLLTFSTNQIGQAELTLEEREFVLRDLESQIFAIFDRTASEKSIKLRVEIEEPTWDPLGMSVQLKDMTLYGDVHRILQILINLVSNSLKYTPADGSVRCIMRRSKDFAPRRVAVEQSSYRSRNTMGSAPGSAPRRSNNNGGTANFINPAEGQLLAERSIAPPGNDIYVEFEVADTGEGISEAMQERIWEPFAQGEVGLNRRHSGTGLGLSICSQLATLMRGSIELRSVVGRGSTFTVKLPLRHVLMTPSTRMSQEATRSSLRPESFKESDKSNKTGTNSAAASRRVSIQVQPEKIEEIRPATVIESKRQEPETPSELASTRKASAASTEQSVPVKKATEKPRKASKDNTEHLSKLRILVAEDNKVNQQVIMRMLKMEQILQVTLAEDGQLALDAVTGPEDSSATDVTPFDLIFMDIQMPNMDGLESTRKIRESGFIGPIVALTAFAEKSNIDDCYEAGMDHFLAKPLQRPALHEVLMKFFPAKS